MAESQEKQTRIRQGAGAKSTQAPFTLPDASVAKHAKKVLAQATESAISTKNQDMVEVSVEINGGNHKPGARRAGCRVESAIKRPPNRPRKALAGFQPSSLPSFLPPHSFLASDRL